MISRIKWYARWHELRCPLCRRSWGGWFWRVLTGREDARWGGK